MEFEFTPRIISINQPHAWVREHLWKIVGCTLPKEWQVRHKHGDKRLFLKLHIKLEKFIAI
jgi:hypothetical protein